MYSNSAASRDAGPIELFFRFDPRGGFSSCVHVALNRDRWTEGSFANRSTSLDNWNDDKLALAQFDIQERGTYIFSLRHTTWQDVQYVRSQIHSGEACIQRPSPNTYVITHTNILSAHCVCITSDNWIPIFQRSLSSSYYPGAWSATFEEGIEPRDFDGRNTFAVAARRGASEELSSSLLTLSLNVVSLLAVIVEREGCNPAVVLSIQLPFTAGELKEKIEYNREFESNSMNFVDATPSELCKFLAGMDQDARQWHPTAKYRLSLIHAQSDGNAAGFRHAVSGA